MWSGRERLVWRAFQCESDTRPSAASASAIAVGSPARLTRKRDPSSKNRPGTTRARPPPAVASTCSDRRSYASATSSRNVRAVGGADAPSGTAGSNGPCPPSEVVRTEAVDCLLGSTGDPADVFEFGRHTNRTIPGGPKLSVSVTDLVTSCSTLLNKRTVSGAIRRPIELQNYYRNSKGSRAGEPRKNRALSVPVRSARRRSRVRSHVCSTRLNRAERGLPRVRSG